MPLSGIGFNNATNQQSYVRREEGKYQNSL
jgi:hypothetical protein